MLGGIKSKADGEYCVKCDAKIVNSYEFCPKCGSALSLDAIKLNGQRKKAVQIELLDELAAEITDEKTLKIIINKLKSL